MISKLEEFKRDYLKIEYDVIKFTIESAVRIKEYPGCEDPSEVFNEVYERQFQAYLGLVKLRDVAMRCSELTSSEKYSVNSAVTRYIERHQKNLNLAVDVTVFQKRV